MKQLTIKKELCTGCQSCQVACSFWKLRVMNPALSRIVIEKKELEGLFLPMVCRQCNDAICAQVCPNQAIVLNQTIGIWEIDSSSCSGCGLCVEACPYNGIHLNSENSIAEKCDLCGGNPQCIRFCTPGAISFFNLE